MQPGATPTAAQRAAHLMAKATRFEKGFRRQYPLLVDYIDGRRPLEECSAIFYRKKIQSHLQLIENLKQEAARLASTGPCGD